jgi:hypothetical protein
MQTSASSMMGRLLHYETHCHAAVTVVRRAVCEVGTGSAGVGR